jgi:peptide/nickel transport system permease protein
MVKKMFASFKKALLFIGQSKKASIGGIMLLIAILIAIFASAIAPYKYDAMNVGELLERPNKLHFMGTDIFGRDVFSRIIYGTRVSLGVSISVVGLSLLLGLPLGLAAGYYGKWIETIVMRLTDIILAFPWVLMALTLTSIMGPGVSIVILAMGIVYAPSVARLVRGVVLSVREREFVEAAIVSGETKLCVVLRYILPNSLAPLIVQSTISVSKAILAEASISYLGYGTQPPMPSWGIMLSDSSDFLWTAPYLSIFPGLAIIYLVLAVNLFGDGLRDMLDPRYKGKVSDL